MYDLIVIGGGPAGMSAAIEARKQGINNILIIERDKELGGILNQCIHNGFGLHTFKEELTGPEYAEKYKELVYTEAIEIKVDTMVLEITKDKTVYAINTEEGYLELKSKAIILALGCRERTRGSINIPGDRPSGIMTAGTAQRYINIEGYMPGKNVLILGSGDIGLIMARRLTLEGASVKAVVELMPYSNGLNRNIVQCLEDYNIPLLLSHTVINIIGNKRLEKVIIAAVDENKIPIKGSEKTFEVDTLLLSVGLIPENELSKLVGIKRDIRTNGVIVDESMETSISGIFACGNVLHVHDLVDYVSEEAERTGKSASEYIKGEHLKGEKINVLCSNGITYTVPQKINYHTTKKEIIFYMRVNNVYKNKHIIGKSGEKLIFKRKKNILIPSEMIKVVIPSKNLENIKDDIIISLEDGE